MPRTPPGPRPGPRPLPSCRHHRPSGRAVVTLSGEDHYLGRFGTPESLDNYSRVIAAWVARGRRPIGNRAPALTLAELFDRFHVHAAAYYVKNGSPTSAARLFREVGKSIVDRHPGQLAAEFRPTQLKAVQRAWIGPDHDWSRRTANGHLMRVKQVFKWAVSEELVPVEVYQALATVDGLAAGRSAAREPRPVRAIPAADLAAVVARLSPMWKTVVTVQDLAAMRPGEVLAMRWAEIDRAGPVWTYRPSSHKTEHHGKARSIHLGPRAQATLSAWVAARPRAEGGYLFVANRAHARAHVTRDSYGDALDVACARAGVPRITPNQIRHTAATRIRAAVGRDGLDAARVVLGHVDSRTTELYAERDTTQAAKLMQELG